MISLNARCRALLPAVDCMRLPPSVIAPVVPTWYWDTTFPTSKVFTPLRETDMETDGLPEVSGRAEARISATERSGSITALGVLLGFSITILGDWSNRPGQWELVGAIPLFLYGSSVALQVVALYRALQLPREIQRDHRRTINLAVIGLVVMFVGFLATIVIDVLEEGPVNTPTAINRH